MAGLQSSPARVDYANWVRAKQRGARILHLEGIWEKRKPGSAMEAQNRLSGIMQCGAETYLVVSPCDEGADEALTRWQLELGEWHFWPGTQSFWPMEQMVSC